MISILSPAKNLDYTTEFNCALSTEITFPKESEKLIKELKKLNPKKIAKLMDVSDNIAELNYNRFQSWKYPFDSTARQAIFAFKGEAYLGLDAYSFTEEDLRYAQNHLRILSGLYGFLSPSDCILPYRLEMGTAFAVGKNKNLYKFWGDKITEKLNADIKAQGDDYLINVASAEYFNAVNLKKLKAKLITCSFKEGKNGEYKTVMIFAKRGRGLMSRFIIKNQISKPEHLLAFDYEGYAYNPKLSSETELVFTRN